MPDFTRHAVPKAPNKPGAGQDTPEPVNTRSSDIQRQNGTNCGAPGKMTHKIKGLGSFQLRSDLV
ncbi:hypothetical protein M407DRAFT_21062 [Tulasnella calospora MUT 4182]|uniref:Uncharacterized protein n=1 Tax=Tulasnella calospora MUT 4182 TaxID=1051891 RepID=A0A0C3QEW7_9AGAM|nr:hypothetical protein M407DRAFT_21062 [Tulasnella calospora MUT 4182]